MGVQSQKRNLLDAPHSGGSPKRVARKLAVIFAERNPDHNLDELNREFGQKFGMRLYSLCEIWHQMRIHNHTLDAVAQAFAAKLAHMSGEKRRLEEIVVAQRAELAKKEKYIAELRGERQPKTAVEGEVREVKERATSKPEFSG